MPKKKRNSIKEKKLINKYNQKEKRKVKREKKERKRLINKKIHKDGSTLICQSYSSRRVNPKKFIIESIPIKVKKKSTLNIPMKGII